MMESEGSWKDYKRRKIEELQLGRSEGTGVEIKKEKIVRKPKLRAGRGVRKGREEESNIMMRWLASCGEVKKVQEIPGVREPINSTGKKQTEEVKN